MVIFGIGFILVFIGALFLSKALIRKGLKVWKARILFGMLLSVGSAILFHSIGKAISWPESAWLGAGFGALVAFSSKGFRSGHKFDMLKPVDLDRSKKNDR